MEFIKHPIMLSNGGWQLEDKKTLVLGTKGTIGCDVLDLTLSGQWLAMDTIVATFTNEKNASVDVMVVDGQVTVPWEATQSASQYGSYIVFTGYKGDTVYKPTTNVPYKVLAHGNNTGAETQAVTPSMQQQFVDAVAENAESAKNAQRGAESAQNAAEQAVVDVKSAKDTAIAAIGSSKSAAIEDVNATAESQKTVLNAIKDEAGEHASSAYTSEQNAQASATDAEKSLQELKQGIASGDFKGDKGDKGADGYTPIKGVDYWTAADVAEIYNHVDDKVEPIATEVAELGNKVDNFDEVVAEKADKSDVVTDVAINGTSIVTDGVANVPVASVNKMGAVKTASWSGVIVYEDTGIIDIKAATNSQITNRSSTAAINTTNFDYAVKVALTDGKGEWTDAEKASARERMGVDGYKLLVHHTFTEDANAFRFDADDDGKPFHLRSMMVLFNRIGDGKSSNEVGSPQFRTVGADGYAVDCKAGYFPMTGQLGNCWYAYCELDGDAVLVDSASMPAGTNAQITNGCLNYSLSRVINWQSARSASLPIKYIKSFYINAMSQNCVTTGSKIWIYGKEF